MGTPRIKDRIDKVHDESNSRYELASMVVELQEEVAALTAELDAVNERFEKHTASVVEWTSTVAEIIGLGEHGKVTPDQILDQLIYGRQWASDMQTKFTAAEAELDAAKRALAELVACKDLKEDIAADSFPAHEAAVLHAEYKVRQPLAWAAACAALAAKSTEQKEGG